MKTVKFICDWCQPREMKAMALRHDVGFSNIIPVDSGEPDYWVIFNGAFEHYDPERTFFFQMEPAPLRSPNIPQVRYDFSIPRHHMPITLGFGCGKHALDLAKPVEKSKLMCSVLSGKRSFPGQSFRCDLALRLQRELPGYDLTGDIIGVPTTKYDYLPPYKYTMTAENVMEPNYFTEKIVDAIVCESLCFYWGCPNIEQFLDPRCYIWLPYEVEKAMAVIRRSIEDNEWEKRIDAIREEKRKLIFEKQLYVWLDKIIGNIQNPA